MSAAAAVAPATPASSNVEAFADKRSDAFAVFLDRLMEVLQQLAPEADAQEREEFHICIRAVPGCAARPAASRRTAAGHGCLHLLCRTISKVPDAITPSVRLLVKSFPSCGTRRNCRSAPRPTSTPRSSPVRSA